MLQGKHSVIFSTFIELPFVIKIFVLSIFEWLLKSGFTVYCCKGNSFTVQSFWEGFFLFQNSPENLDLDFEEGKLVL